MTRKVLSSGLYDAFALVKWHGQLENRNDADHYHPQKAISKMSPRTYSATHPWVPPRLDGTSK